MIGKLSEIEEKAIREFSGELRKFSGRNIKRILLFGSKARGDFSKESDLDLFVHTDQVDPALKHQAAKIVNKILLKYGVLISPRLVPEIRYIYQKRLETGFIKNVEKDGIKIE
jgi:predicted nucleotidyltransferase